MLSGWLYDPCGESWWNGNTTESVILQPSQMPLPYCFFPTVANKQIMHSMSFVLVVAILHVCVWSKFGLFSLLILKKIGCFCAEVWCLFYLQYLCGIFVFSSFIVRLIFICVVWKFHFYISGYIFWLIVGNWHASAIKEYEEEEDWCYTLNSTQLNRNTRTQVSNTSAVVKHGAKGLTKTWLQDRKQTASRQRR